MARASELLITSNRLPVSVALDGDEPSLTPSSGGLVAGLRTTALGRLWIGWPGATVPGRLEGRVAEALAAESCRPVFLSTEEERNFYDVMCNDGLWPLFHYFVDRFEFSDRAWQSYVEVNERFADAVAEASPRGARVWVHDFHLALVPQALRCRRPDLAIGFFLHVPFPSPEIYRVLPTGREFLRGILGSDYIGFHTDDYLDHFRAACSRLLGIDPERAKLEHDGRRIGTGVHPIGIDVQGFRETVRDPATAIEAAHVDLIYRDKELFLGVDRLDYTKGIVKKLEAFERFLEEDPRRAETTRMLQVLVPSRVRSPA